MPPPESSDHELTRELTRLERTQTAVSNAVKHFPYWIFPLLSGFFWFGMLWALLIVWLAQGQPKYTSMSPDQRIAYISDVGADTMKPLFITGSTLTGIFFLASLLATRYNHALVRRLERTLDIFSTLACVIASVSLILLAVFDTRRHPSLHRLFLLLFMLGVIFSALFTTVEYRRLGKTYTDISVVRQSYRFKQIMVVLELFLSIAFGVCMYRKLNNAAAILEWLVAFIFTSYVLSFFFDLRPSARTKELAEKRARQDQSSEMTESLRPALHRVESARMSPPQLAHLSS